jgi:hypothetical protein
MSKILSLMAVLVAVLMPAGTAAADPNPGGPPGGRPPDPNQGCPPAEGQSGATFWQTVDADFYGVTDVDVNGDTIVCWLFLPNVTDKNIFVDNRLPNGS